MDVKERTEGVVIGLLLGFDDGAPLVVFPGNPDDTAQVARALCRLDGEDAGCEVALLFEDGNRTRPLIIGRIEDPVREDRSNRPARVVHDGETVRITAQDRLRSARPDKLLQATARIVSRWFAPGLLMTAVATPPA